MENLVEQFQQTVLLLQNNISFLLLLIGILWLIQFVNWLLQYRLNILGLYPRSIPGIFGIFFSPFLHGDFNHLFFNSIPLFILACFVSLQGWLVFYCVSLTIILLGGFAVWLFGRKAIHIGASGLVMGYWSYLLLNVKQFGLLMSIVLAIVCFYYLGALAANLFPISRESSWEAHVFGFLAGVAAAYFCGGLGLTSFIH